MLLLFAVACGPTPETPAPGGANPAAGTPAPAASTPAPLAGDNMAVAALARAELGDLDQMITRRTVRIAVAYSKTNYFLDRGQPHGATYEFAQKFEEDLNSSLGTGHLKVIVAFMPMSRERLLRAVVDGQADLAAAALTVTPERQALVDFSEPTRTGVNEVVVSGPSSPPIASLEDLAGREVFVRESSSYYQSLLALNGRLTAAGKPAVVLKPAPEVLEDEDLMEMVNAGLVRYIVVDEYLATFWKQMFPAIVPHPDLVLRSGGTLAVAMRKGSPKLMAAVNGVLRRYPEGSTFRNIVSKRYWQSTKFAKNAAAEADMQRFRAMADLFKKYGSQYDLDYLLMAAQGYQESGLNQDAKSRVGAVGVMQVMPATGKELKVGDIAQTDANIHAGVKYIRQMIDTQFAKEPMTKLDKGLFAFAAYNAGPGRVASLRKEAAKRGLDPNVWFNNVEQIAAERIGRETVQYVSNIYKYYVAYTLVMENRTARERAK
jgi:membrane-bound lytic murein transglycosylase MltF